MTPLQRDALVRAIKAALEGGKPHPTFSEPATKSGKVGLRAIDCVRFEGEGGHATEPPPLDQARAAYAAAFDVFARLALTYFENPSDELRDACEAAALVVRTVEKAG